MLKIRKIILIVFVLVFALAPLSFSVSLDRSQAADFEKIEFDQEWKIDKTIDKNVVIYPGVTLIVRKGVTLTFAGGEIDVRGSMIVSGTVKKPVIFKKADGSRWTYSISVKTDGKLIMRNADVSGGGYMAYASKENSIFNSALASGAITGAVDINGGWLDVENSNFHDNETAIFISNKSPERIKVNRSKFVDNENYDINYIGTSGSSLNFRYNWWGSPAGPPKTCGAPDECWYNKFETEVNFSNWLTSEYFRDPVIIIPGILGSWKWTDGGEWKIDPIFKSYDTLIETFEKNGYEENKDLFVFPYQWRDSNVNNAILLRDRIADIKLKENWPKVDVVAHSMGGLLAREYIESGYYNGDIDQLVTLGTPHNGAPEDYLMWDGGEIPPSSSTIIDLVFKLIFKQEAKESGFESIFDYLHNMPIKSVQELLPVYDYLFDIESDKERSYVEGEHYPKNDFLKTLNNSANLKKLNNVEFTNIVGKLDKNKTISEIRVGKPSLDENSLWAHGFPEKFDSIFGDRGLEYGSGDGTVPLESAENIASDEIIELKFSHGDLPAEGADVVYETITGNLPQKDTEPTFIDNILAFFVFSPIDVQVISPSGIKYGKDFKNSENFESVNGSYYTGFGAKSEFITIPNPEDGEYTILTHGTGSDDYTIEVAKISKDKNDPQIATESTVEIKGMATPEKQEELKVEVKGEQVSAGEPKDITPPVITASVITEPDANGWYGSDVTIHFLAEDSESGIEGENQKDIILSGEGKNQSVTETFSDKAGNTSSKTVSGINIDKTAPEAKLVFNPLNQKLDITGVDNLSQNVSVETKEQEIIGSNHQDGRKNVFWFFQWIKKGNGKKTIATATLSDEAGHQTELIWEKKKDKDRRIDLAISSISYDGEKVDLSGSGLQYKWMLDWRKNKYLLFASHINTASMSVESHYFPKKNQTWLMQKPKELADDDNDDGAENRPVWKKLPGMIIPSLATAKGNLVIKY